MLTRDLAAAFVHQWIEAFNSHDVEKIMDHYATEVEFHSPFISMLQFNEHGVITNKADLKAYFRVGLDRYPDLHFELHRYFTGMTSLVICYTSVNGQQAAETFELNREGKATRVFCHYL